MSNSNLPFTCAECTKLSCRKEGNPDMPSNCPMLTHPDVLKAGFEEYVKEENHEFYLQSAYMESDAFGRFPRLKETILFCKRMGYQHIGLAFCSGLGEEAKIVSKLMRKAGLTVESVRCKCGGMRKDLMGIERSHWVRPDHDFEPSCNPVGQAMLLEEKKTEFNVVMGLCVGHDTLFLKYCDTPCTVLVVKDRVCGHNPVAAIYLHEHDYWGSLYEEDPKRER